MIDLELEQQSWQNAMSTIRSMINKNMEGIEREMARRSYRVANQGRNELVKVMQGTRSGREYKVSGTHQDKGTKKTGVYYTASAPGEVPAMCTGGLRASYAPKITLVREHGNMVCKAGIESGLRSGQYLIGELLEEGTIYMAPRPYREKVLERLEPYAFRIYSQPYPI